MSRAAPAGCRTDFHMRKGTAQPWLRFRIQGCVLRFQFVSAHSGPASSCMKNSLPGMVGMRLEVTAFVGP